MGLAPYTAATLLLLAAARADNATSTDTCEPDPFAEGPWSEALQEWALAAPAHSDRHGRIMALPPAQGYYVTDRVDRPPPPPSAARYGPHGSYGPQGSYGPHGSYGSQGMHGPQNVYGPQGTHGQGSYVPQGSNNSQQGSPGPQGSQESHGPPLPLGPFPYDEWQASPPPPPDSKIVNRPTYPNNDKFKPSYQSPPASQQIPARPPAAPSRPSAVDRIGEAPQKAPAPVSSAPSPGKQVSETDLYLLSAIEKLVWRVDLMEKRLRRMEESMHYLVAGAETKPEPCVANFSRVGSVCYHISSEAADWKSANLQCRKLRANLLELETETERRTAVAALLGDKRLRGVDVWTGGLNPGLLWIWSHSARPVAGNTTDGGGAAAGGNGTATVVGEGRCLALVHDPAVNNYVYRGQDCALRHRFICEKEEDKAKLSNEIERVARTLRTDGRGRRARVTWADADD